MYCNSYDKGAVEGGVPPDKFGESSDLRIIPFLLSMENEFFSFKDSTFNMEKYKAASSRQIFFTEFGVKNSFTLENSFFKKYR